MNSFDLSSLYNGILDIIVYLYQELQKTDEDTFNYIFFDKIDRFFTHANYKIQNMNGEACKKLIYTDKEFLDSINSYRKEQQLNIKAIINANIVRNKKRIEEIKNLNDEIEKLKGEIEQLKLFIQNEEPNEEKKEIITEDKGIQVDIKDEIKNEAKKEESKEPIKEKKDKKIIYDKSYEFSINLDSEVDIASLKSKPKRILFYKTDNIIQRNDLIKEIQNKREKLLTYELIEEKFETKNNIYWFIIKPKVVTRVGFKAGKGIQYENTNPFISNKMKIEEIERKGSRLDIDNFVF